MDDIMEIDEKIDESEITYEELRQQWLELLEKRQQMVVEMNEAIAKEKAKIRDTEQKLRDTKAELEQEGWKLRDLLEAETSKVGSLKARINEILDPLIRKGVEAALTAQKNVELPLLLTKLSASERKKRAAIALDIVGLSHRAGHYPRQLSGGEQQRTGIARAIVTDPTLLLCDEPTGDLDRKSGDEILDLLQALNKEQGKTIIMVTHDIHAAARATRTLYLNKGQLSAEPVD